MATKQAIIVSKRLTPFFDQYIFPFYPHVTTACINFIDYEPDTGLVSYIKTDSPNIQRFSTKDLWDNQVRDCYSYKTKFGRLLKELYSDLPILDSEVEKIGRIWNTYITDLDKVNLKLWPSEKIKYAYNVNNYHNNSGTLGNSCMREPDRQKLLTFYEINNVKILVLLDNNNKIMGRALVWCGIYFESLKDKTTLMDRIYVNSDSHLPLFYKFAEKNKFLLRNDSASFKNPNNNDVFADLCWLNNINLDGILCIPYADTLRFLFYKDKILSNCNDIKSINRINITFASNVIPLTRFDTYIKELDPKLTQEIFTNDFIPINESVKIEYTLDGIKQRGYIQKQNIIFLNADKAQERPYHYKDPSICRRFNVKEHNYYTYKNWCVEVPTVGFVLKSQVVEVHEINEATFKLQFKNYILDEKTHLKHLLRLDSGHLIDRRDPLFIKYIEPVPSNSKQYRLWNPERKLKTISNNQLNFSTKRGKEWLDPQEQLFYEYIEPPQSNRFISKTSKVRLIHFKNANDGRLLNSQIYCDIPSMKNDERDSWYVQTIKPDDLQTWWRL